MKFKSRHRISMTLESVALADIVMNLFIFFFVTFSLLASFNPQKQARLKIDLPKGNKTAAEKESADSNVVVGIAPGGIIYVNKEQVTLDQLDKKLKLALSNKKEKIIELHADRALVLQRFVEVLDIVQNAGASRVMVHTEVKK
jgi:biopolymer transport protein ExbD